ncbi:cyclic di-GMP phosphodiesterase Gmr [Caedimonas varicaedens]|uniref:Cyclic di-GMP phosphodiesterase Gmr n=1 Tax=Caedimonas varicaedens TaxID=1629334 RepID=A0A0K8MFA4_9PROT|nr:cyclic di-GMP phosphodiesterase Gmr [Caedimonas varicaedens]
MTSSTNNLRIIIIDDNPEIHKDFIKILATDQSSVEVLNDLEKALFAQEDIKPAQLILPHFEIDTVSQGQEGVEYIKKALKEGKPYALAFVDVRMPPGWDGIETIKHIWELDRDMQIVICTAYSDYSWEETIDELGVSDNLLILKKPFDNVSVRQLACALTKKWQLMQESREHTESLEKHIQERTDSLQKSLSLTRATLESSTDGILVVDSADKVIDFNKNFVTLWKISSSIMDLKDNKIIVEYVSEQLQDPKEFLANIQKIKSHPEEKKFDVLKFVDGRVFERYSQPHKVNGKTVGRVWSFRDVTKRVYLEEKLEYQATHDTLTDLPNRALLSDRINQAIAAAKRDHTFVGVLFFDLDRFKLINDSLSHEAGDELLKSFAKRIKESIREGDTLSRIGGDEFVMVLPNLHKEEEAMSIANKVLLLMQSPFLIAKRKVIVTASIGISLYPKDGKNSDELLKNADLAMYRSKESGSNQFQFYTDDLNKQSLEYLEKETELRQAITKNELFLCYQPQVKLTTGEIVAVEALIRWQHPKKGLLLPMDFIPLAEETGLIIPIGEWVLRTACLQNKAWQDSGFPPIRVAVNLANQQLKQPDLVAMIRNVLQETGLDPQYLEIELTENVLINNIEVINRIHELKEMGMQIALDDFGTGYTNINYLKQIPLNSLKLDKSIIDNIDSNRSDEVIMQAIIAMASSLNFEVLAEGVETQKQLDCLKTVNCENIQGFYFSKPLLSQDIEELLKKPDSFKTQENTYIKAV